MSIRGWVLGCILAFSGSIALADSFVFFDFDNVAAETRRTRDGSFRTPIRVFRVDQRENAAQPLAPEAPYVDLDPWDWERLRSFLAKGPMELGSVARVDTLQDGSKFQPGRYMVSNPESFQFFLESPPGENYLLQQWQDAYARDTAKKFLGMAWPVIRARFSDPSTAKTTGFISARGHSDPEWEESWRFVFEQEGLNLARLPDPRNIHGASRAEYDKFDVLWRIPHIKKGILSTIAGELGRRPLTDADLRISSDGKGVEKAHSLVFFDDNQETIRLVTELFERLAMSRRYPIKFVIGNLGLDSEVRHSRKPRFYVVTRNGRARKAQPIEVFGEPAGWVATDLPAIETKSCRGELSAIGEEV